jgi:DNA-binding transcriptional MerR regulator
MVASMSSLPDDHDASQLIQIGALASASGVTVRTLHHYDAIGLLVPDERTPSGRRLYSQADVIRLYRIVALRRLRLPLEQIAALLEHEPDLTEAIASHLERVEHELELQRSLWASRGSSRPSKSGVAR